MRTPLKRLTKELLVSTFFSALKRSGAKHFSAVAVVLCLTVVVMGPFAQARASCAELFRPKPWFEQVVFEEIEQTLAVGKIIKIEGLHTALEAKGKKPSGTTPNLYLFTFENGTQAVWKSEGWATYGEIAAYKLAKLVGFNLVPPTVERQLTIDNLIDLDASFSELVGQKGSLQFFVDTPIDLLNIGKEERKTLFANVPKEQKSARDMFNFVFGQWDLHTGNVLIDASNSFVSIDNGGIRGRLKVRYGELPFRRALVYSKEVRKKLGVRESGPFPFESAVFLANPSKEDLWNVVKDVVAPEELDKFWKWRKDTKDTTMKIVFWDNGVWVQSIGYGNYGPLQPEVFDSVALEKYRSLTVDKLLEVMPPDIFSIESVYDILERRDQILKAAKEQTN